MKVSKGSLALALVIIPFLVYQGSFLYHYNGLNNDYYNRYIDTSDDYGYYWGQSSDPELNSLSSIGVGMDISPEFTIFYQDLLLLRSYDRLTTEVYNCSNPSAIKYVGMVDIGEGELQVAGDHLYGTKIDGSMGEWDLSDIDNPVFTPLNRTYDVIVGNLGYEISTMLSVYNLTETDPALSLISSFMPTSSYLVFSEIILKDSIAVLMEQDGVRIIDISNSSDMKQIAEIETKFAPISMVLVNSSLYISDTLGLYSYNILAPSNPILRKFDSGFGLRDMMIRGNYLYGRVARQFDGEPSGLRCYNIENPYTVKEVVRNDYVSLNRVLLAQNALIGLGINQGSQSDYQLYEIISLNITVDAVNDLDKDGLSFHDEVWNRGTDPHNNDTDGDGMEDGFEVPYFIGERNRDSLVLNIETPYLDPLKADADADPDRDGLTNAEEIALGTIPVDIDSDDDGWKDGEEVANNYDPLNDAVPSDVFRVQYILFFVGLGLAFLIKILESAGLLTRHAPLDVFLSHAVIDYEPYKLLDMVNTLQTYKAVDETLYCERNMRGNIDEWMVENVPLSHIFLFIATQKSVFNSPDCAKEIALAKECGLFVLPVRTPEVKWEDIANIGLPSSGFEYSKDNTKPFYEEIKEYFAKMKADLDQIHKKLKGQRLFSMKSFDKMLELNPGESARLAKILIKDGRITGVLSADYSFFLGTKETKNRVRDYAGKDAMVDIDIMLDAIGISADFKEEVVKIAKIKDERIIKPKNEEEDIKDVSSELTSEPVGEPTVEETPAEPVEETPAEPVEERPTEPVEERPTEPVEERPTEPVEETPTEPVEETPTEPVGETPTEPVGETPTEPVGETPTEPVGEKSPNSDSSDSNSDSDEPYPVSK